ncbi:unnamed protein product [Mytilus edulis]|uniref:DUF6451 domain-containing protein n=1 Tax=Mytilus edulis TaxID=6550 RepID=A0A8S3SRS7_MYTED|nr:unnamed protein product [Mytilus edulis]
MQYKHKNWMSDNTWVKVEERRIAKEKVLNATTRQQKRQTQDLYREKDQEVKKNCKQDKRDYVEQLAQEAEIACSKGDIKSLYNTTKQLSGRRSNSMIDWVSRKSYNTPLGIKWTLQSCLEDLDFADDICQLSHRHEDSQKQAANLETTAKQVGLYINAKKTKSMRVNTNQLNKTKVRDAEIEDVREFTYLGSVISTSGGTDEDIQSRKRKAQQAFAILKPVWRSKALRSNTKIRIFNSNVKSILLYGSETWRLTAASTKTLQVFMNSSCTPPYIQISGITEDT